MRYVKAFIVTAPTMALWAHYLTEEPMPWWPDTFLFGGFMGALGAFVVLRVLHFRHAAVPVRGVWRWLRGERS